MLVLKAWSTYTMHCCHILLRDSPGPEGRKLVEAGMAHWMNHTCIQFVERTTEQDYILIVESVG